MQLVYCYTDDDGTTFARFYDGAKGENVMVEYNDGAGTWLESRETAVY